MKNIKLHCYFRKLYRNFTDTLYSEINIYNIRHEENETALLFQKIIQELYGHAVF
jgi:hypothetical protein